MIIPKVTFVYDRKKSATRTKPSVVEIRITDGKKRKYISTGVKLLPKEWQRGVVVGREDWRSLNDQLQAMIKRTSDIVTKMMEEDSVDLDAIPDMLKESMTKQGTFLDYAKDICERRKKKLRQSTQDRYELVMGFLEKWGGMVRFSDVTERNVQKMDDELEKSGLQPQSRRNYHNIIKMCVTHAFNDGLIKRNPYAKFKAERGEECGLSKYLTPNEFKKIENCELADKKLDRVRDLFVFQTYTMLAYSDLEAFRKEKCERMGGQLVYRSTRVKTGEEFTVVILKPALDILKKYNGKLPIMCNSLYNKRLKELAREVKINKALTTHWARHTGATLLLNDGGVPMHIVQRILGHASIKMTEKTYAKVLDKSIVESMVGFEKKRKG